LGEDKFFEKEEEEVNPTNVELINPLDDVDLLDSEIPEEGLCFFYNSRNTNIRII
jgi:hypothetical protein